MSFTSSSLLSLCVYFYVRVSTSKRACVSTTHGKSMRRLFLHPLLSLYAFQNSLSPLLLLSVCDQIRKKWYLRHSGSLSTNTLTDSLLICSLVLPHGITASFRPFRLLLRMRVPLFLHFLCYSSFASVIKTARLKK